MWMESLGVKPAFVIAGFFGSLISLQFIRDLTPGKAIFAVLTGCGFAAYATPFVDIYLKLEQPSENAGAFLLGLLAMNIAALLVRKTREMDV